MGKLPTQLRWSEFVAALTSPLLGFKQLPSKGGSARHFQRLSDGEILTFHEPHGGDTLRQGTLREYLRHLKLTREQFEDCLSRPSINLAEEEEAYRRSLDNDGTIVSNCMNCFAIVAKSKIEDEIIAAEASHTCPELA